MKIIITIFMMLLFGLSIPAQSRKKPSERLNSDKKQTTAEQLIALNQELIDALARGDKTIVARIYGDDFVRISVDGEVFTKAQILEGLKPSAPGFKTFYESLNIKTFDYGDTVILVYLSIRHREVNSVKVPDFYYQVADTFVKRKGRWQKVLSTGTPIPAKNTSK
jgi:hypothetical protein